MAGTSAGQLALVKETVAGATPATPAFKILDMTGADLKLSVTQTRSAAVTPQRVVRSSRRTGREVGNGFNFELYKGPEVDEILAALLGNAFAGGPPAVAKAGGTTMESFTIEHRLSAADYRRYVGCQLSMGEFTIAPEQIIGVRVGVVGYSMVTAVAAIAGATYANPTDVDKLTALDVAAVTLSDGITASLDYESLSFTLNNQKVARKRIGPASVRGISEGQALVTGSARIYVTQEMANAYVADTSFDMDVPTMIGGSGYTFLFKNVKLTDLSEPNTGNDDEYMSNIEFEATIDATFGSSFGISKTS